MRKFTMLQHVVFNTYSTIIDIQDDIPSIRARITRMLRRSRAIWICFVFHASATHAPRGLGFLNRRCQARPPGSRAAVVVMGWWATACSVPWDSTWSGTAACYVPWDGHWSGTAAYSLSSVLVLRVVANLGLSGDFSCEFVRVMVFSS